MESSRLNNLDGRVPKDKKTKKYTSDRDLECAENKERWKTGEFKDEIKNLALSTLRINEISCLQQGHF